MNVLENKALAWILDRAKVEERKGETIWSFKGNITPRHAADLRKLLKEADARRSDGKTSTKYGVTLENTEEVSDSVVIVFGNYTSSRRTVRVQRIRYTD